MSDTEEDDSPINLNGGVGSGIVKIGRWLFVEPLKMTVGAAGSVVFNGVFAFLPTVFSGIVLVLKPIFMVLYYILFKIVPYFVTYVGIPLFILGAVMAVMFMGGHMLMIIVFIVGLFMYIKGLLNIKLTNGPIATINDVNDRDVLKVK